MSRARKAKLAETLDRRHILAFNRERIEQAYVKAEADGMECPAIFTLDVRDEVAYAMASRHVSREDLAQLARDTAAKDMIPTVFLAMPLEGTLGLLGELVSAESLRSLAEAKDLPGVFLVVAIGSDGVQAAYWPVQG